MPAEITSTVRLAVGMPDGSEVRAEVGLITISVHPDGVDISEVHRALGELLIDAGRYMVNSAPAPGPAPQGEGESPSRG